MKTEELTGALLDYWVARAEGLEALIHAQAGCCIEVRDENGLAEWEEFAPSKDWAQCGPLIDKWCCDMTTGYGELGGWGATPKLVREDDDYEEMRGSNPQEAICRAVVRGAFGDEVPDVQ